MATNNDGGSAAPEKSDHGPNSGDKGSTRTGAPSNYNVGLAVMAGLGSEEENGSGEGEGKKKRTAAVKGGSEGEDSRGGDAGGEGEGDGDENRGKGGNAGDDNEGAGGEGRGAGDDGENDGDDGEGRGAGGDADGEGEDDDADGDDNSPEAKRLKALALETKQQLGRVLKDLGPDQRKVVEGVIGSRIGKIVKQHSTEVERLQTQIADVTGDLEESQRSKGPITISGVHPALLVDSEGDLAEIQHRHEEFLDWADDNRDGFNLADSENYDPSKPTYTAEEIRRRVRTERRENDRILPQARDNLKKRAEHDTAMRKAMPALFDSKTPEYRAQSIILKEQPWLRQFPDFRLRVAKQILGEKALAGLMKPKEQQARGQGNNQQQQQSQQRKAPRLPGSGGGGGSGKGGSDGRRPGGSGAPEALKNFGKNPTQSNLASIVGRML